MPRLEANDRAARGASTGLGRAQSGLDRADWQVDPAD